MNIVLEIDGVRYKYEKFIHKVSSMSIDVCSKSCALKKICGSHHWVPDMCNNLDSQIDGVGYFVKEEL